MEASVHWAQSDGANTAGGPPSLYAARQPYEGDEETTATAAVEGKEEKEKHDEVVAKTTTHHWRRRHGWLQGTKLTTKHKQEEIYEGSGRCGQDPSNETLHNHSEEERPSIGQDDAFFFLLI